MIRKLDHINIITLCLEQTVRFYTEVLGMRSGEVAGLPAGRVFGAWIYDDTNTPVLHVQGVDPENPEKTLKPVRQRLDVLAGTINAGSLRGSGGIEHVAFECSDYDALHARLIAAHCELRYNEVARIGLRQIFVNDPNDITLELNFRS
jgi:catechol 2,3-dioxygenase-like lactoylglutathione lyase family enzyme